jgi:hypothetical protein
MHGSYLPHKSCFDPSHTTHTIIKIITKATYTSLFLLFFERGTKTLASVSKWYIRTLFHYWKGSIKKRTKGAFITNHGSHKVVVWINNLKRSSLEKYLYMDQHMSLLSSCQPHQLNKSRPIIFKWLHLKSISWRCSSGWRHNHVRYKCITCKKEECFILLKLKII